MQPPSKKVFWYAKGALMRKIRVKQASHKFHFERHCWPLLQPSVNHFCYLMLDELKHIGRKFDLHQIFAQHFVHHGCPTV